MIKRTFDLDVIHSVFKNKNLAKYLTDDFTEIEEYPIHDMIYYLEARDTELIGLFMCVQMNSICLDAHVAMLQRGRKTKVAGNEAIEWIFKNTGYEKINATIPMFNKLAIKYAKDIGFTEEGVNRGSFIRNGKIHDQLYLGIRRPSCHQR